MRVLLINPPFPGGFREFNLSLPPLGLGYIASMLEHHGYGAKILDLSVERWNGSVAGYDAVGITSLTPTFPRALKIAEQIKAEDAEIPVILGGPHASFVGREAFDAFDFVVRGEGEYTMLELLSALEKGSGFENIAGISYLEGGEVKRNPDRPFIEDLDALPFPARHLFNHSAKGYMKMEGKPLATVVSSRGCPFGCSFCSSSRLTGLKWRARSPGNVVDELEEIVSTHGIKNIAFVDDNFSLSPKRVIEICREIEKRGLSLRWACMSRVDTVVKNPEMVEHMRRAGCCMVYMGIESANQEVLNSYRKRTSVDMIKQAFKILRENGIGIIGSFIIGELRETKEMIKATIRFAKELDPDVAQFSILTPLPGSELWNRVKDRIVRKNLELFDGMHAVMRTDNISPKELEKLLVRAYREFYLRPRRILRELIFMAKTGDFNGVKNLWKFLRMRYNWSNCHDQTPSD